MTDVVQGQVFRLSDWAGFTCETVFKNDAEKARPKNMGEYLSIIVPPAQRGPT